MEEKVSLRIRLENGVDKNGKKKTATLLVNRVNPQVSTEDLDAIGKAIVGLQKLELIDMYRVETKSL